MTTVSVFTEVLFAFPTTEDRIWSEDLRSSKVVYGRSLEGYLRGIIKIS